ncbi:hypothetical protein [Paenibacillus silvae]|uniref:Uncharacterized protein n=1 Tax=Paenibacillus silvae TaxID=1325358 RepID=A0A2W6NXA3_9BACL|nr:hypothetical protein [Paenibacillus silvae]PZT52000.1 hypothetical protein DN757_29690 [Paenibacillus silvae]
MSIPLEFMLGMTHEEFEHWVWCGEHNDDNVVDLHKEALRLCKELEEAKQSVVEEAKQADMWHELYLRALNDQDQQLTVSVLASFARTVIQKALNDESTSGGELKELAMEHLLIEEDPDQFEDQYRFTEVLALVQEGEGNECK